MGCLAKDDCRAPVMPNGYCYQHNPEISFEEKQRARSLGGKSSRKVEVWQVPTEVDSIETLLDVKKAYNSLYLWLLQGFISPAQAIAAKSIVSGLREAIIDEQTLEILGYRERLKNVLGNGGNHHEQLESAIETDNGS